MLLNPSHEITHAGLPQDVQERYVRYKQGSRAIVNWMTKYGPDKYKGRKTLPVKQMVALGRLLCAKKDEISSLPPDVDYYFKEVIRERTFLSQHFRKHRDQCQRDEIDTINHEHFTESLRQIYAILLTVGKPHRPRKTGHAKPRSSTSSISEVAISFHHLLVQDGQDSDAEALSDTDTDATSNCSHFSSSSGDCEGHESDHTDFLDAEGEIGMTIEIVTFLDKLTVISQAIKSCWVEAGKGDFSIPSAAAYTNILVGKAVVAIWDLAAEEEDIHTFEQLRNELERHGLCHDHTLFSEARVETLDDLCDIETGLGERSATVAGASCESKGLAELLTTDLKIMSRQRQLPTVVQDGITFHEALRVDGGKFSRQSSLSQATTVFLVSISHRAYSQAISKPALKATPRISALKTANEALASIRGFIDDKTIFPCQCINTLNYRITQMQHELQEFAKYRCWNTLLQSPLVAGNHSLEILDLCSFYGMHLLHYRHYVAAVLHTFHALVSINKIETNTVLEEVCDTLAPVLYSSGNRPATGFMASWLRYTGARLRFKTGKRHQNHKDTWCMSIPAHAAARAAGLNISGKQDAADQPAKFDFGTIDYTCRLKRSNWILTQDESTALDCELMRAGYEDNPAQLSGSVPLPMAKRQTYKRTRSCVSKAIDEPCQKVDHLLRSCFCVDSSKPCSIPSSRLNLLALFHSMTKVVAGISDAAHAKGSADSTDGKGQMCLCFAQTILRAVDRVQDVRKRKGIDAVGGTFTKNEKECVECYREHLTHMLEQEQLLGGDASAWLWSSI